MCTDCDQAATVAHWHGYSASCSRCLTRAVDQAGHPIWARYLDALRTAGADDKALNDAKSAVGREYARIRDLRAAEIKRKEAA